MNYRIMRGVQEYGPYTLADLEHYVASGSISPDDLTRSDVSQHWVYVSQVVGNIPLLAAPGSPVRIWRSDLRRNGDTLIIRRGAKLPPICVKCGQHTDEPGVGKTFYWASPWYTLQGSLVYMLVRKKMSLIVPLCDEHRSDRKKKLWIGGSLLATSVVLIVFGFSFLVSNTETFVGFGIVGCLVALLGIVLIEKSVLLRPEKIDDEEGVFLGAGEQFLEIVESGLVPLANVARCTKPS